MRLVAGLALAMHAAAFQSHVPERRKAYRLAAHDVNKRMGDAVALAGLSLYQQGVSAMTLSGDWSAPVSINVGSAFVRGCRVGLSLFRRVLHFTGRDLPVPLRKAL